MALGHSGVFVRVFPPFSGGCYHELSVMLVYFCALCFHWGCVLLGTELAVLPGGLAGDVPHETMGSR